ncbi:MAG: PspC domain-containing protein [Gammaproteobacteria bacterium]|nr:PspC domain-containing protein [Gammaproteobacteria bacterium]
MSRNGSGNSPNNRRSIQDATRNLERAVEELASAATEEVSGRAARLLDDAAARIRGESGGRDEGEPATAGKAERAGGRRERRSRRIHYDDYEDFLRRSRGLYLDRENRKIVGVCAGVARYLGIEAWVARCAALTGLLFLPSVVFPAYWVAFFVMGYRPSAQADAARRNMWKGGSHGRKRAERLRRRADKRRREARRGRRRGDSKRDHDSAKEFGPKFSPRQSLRAAKADFAEIELRLRRMESFVTSDRYALDRGFAEIGAATMGRSAPGAGSPRDE